MVTGYWAAKQKFGNSSISWSRLMQPTIDMCRNGITVSWTHANTLAGKQSCACYKGGDAIQGTVLLILKDLQIEMI